ncbi:class C sortase [Bifidobacterium amazonense]|uniref:Class C sortase n=1 Tax=Bifidobacterium amazonense TaxID=2809027 RepID=A0ABS9VX96_9BIFI|nr:class C sortase [Bifidobacterium amazonense]MCH9276440.1 class C sortase [Bifidobacterium amazonense]
MTAKRRKRPIDIISTVVSAFFAVVLVVGVGLLAYPSVTDWWNRMHQSRAVATYIEQTEDLSQAKKTAMLTAAREYNEQLLSVSDRWRLTDEQKKEYESILDVSGTGIMGYVTIPKLKVRFPVYHGTDEGVLQIAIGHLEGSSLPVGGASTHAVVSGHTGLPSAKLLTGLDTLVKGDTFAFHVLDETYTYQVDQISVVLPNELDKLNIEDGKDYATVVTCTPYGVNTHRLLVRGHRIPNPTTPDTTDYDTPVRTYTTAIIAVAATVLVLGVIIVRWLIVRRRRPHGGHSTGNNSKSNASGNDSEYYGSDDWESFFDNAQ